MEKCGNYKKGEGSDNVSVLMHLVSIEKSSDT